VFVCIVSATLCHKTVVTHRKIDHGPIRPICLTHLGKGSKNLANPVMLTAGQLGLLRCNNWFSPGRPSAEGTGAILAERDSHSGFIAADAARAVVRRKLSYKSLQVRVKD
jgi:hypothetical protein